MDKLFSYVPISKRNESSEIISIIPSSSKYRKRKKRYTTSRATKMVKFFCSRTCPKATVTLSLAMQIF